MSHDLPILLTSFIGCQGEITSIKRKIANTHMLTLSGQGGSGKALGSGGVSFIRFYKPIRRDTPGLLAKGCQFAGLQRLLCND